MLCWLFISSVGPGSAVHGGLSKGEETNKDNFGSTECGKIGMNRSRSTAPGS